MNRYSVLSSVPGSMALIKNRQTSIDPFIFMDKKKLEIVHQLEELECNQDESAQYFLTLKDILRKLKTNRAYKTRTYDYLEEAVKKLPAKIRLFSIFFLMKAINSGDSWMHSFNCLTTLANRYLLHLEDQKFMSEVELLELIEEDEKEPLIFEESILEKFYTVFNDGFIWEPASKDVFKNWFRFTPVGCPVIKDEMITYFCYAVWGINESRLTHICPNIEQWYSALTGKKTTFSKLKSQAVGRNKNEVDKRIEHIMHLRNG